MMDTKLFSRAAVLFAGVWGGGIAAAETEQKPNVLLIMVDDLRPELGCYGAPQVLTPNIDKLAADGALFRNAYCNIPISGASRASLLTGIYPDLPSRFARFDSWAEREVPDAAPISQWFRDNGYTSLSYGKIFHNLRDHYNSWSNAPWRYQPNGYGADWAEYNKWELWLNDESANHVLPRTKRGPFCEMADVPDSLYLDGRLARKVVSDMGELARGTEPFFLAVGFWRPHLPFNAPKRYWDLYDREQIDTAPNKERSVYLPAQVTGSTEIRSYALAQNTTTDDFHREARHGYYACVSFIDAQVGLILDKLESLGLSSNTIVVLLGDHGWHLGEHGFWGKHNLMEQAVKVPLIVSVPGVKGRDVEGVAEFVDLYPTLCDAVGIPIPEHVQGVSQMAVIKGRKRKVKECAFTQWGDGIAVSDGRFNYACWPENEKYSTAEMLFDHKTDRGENFNAVGDSRYRKKIDWFRRQASAHKEMLNKK